MIETHRYLNQKTNANKLAVETLKKIGELADKVEIQADPIHFALIYESLLKNDPELVGQINHLLNKKEYNHTNAKILFSELWSKIIQQDLPSDELSHILSGLLDNIGSWLTDSETNNQELAKNITEISSEPDFPKALSILKQKCLPNLERTQQNNQQMQQDAKDIIAEVEQLKKELDKATLIAKTDELTGIANRRGFNEFAESLLQNNEVTELALVAFDIDFFKKINDTHGHLIGDSVLRYFALIFKKSIKGQDFIARTGGEEFILLLPNTSLDSATKVANNIRMKIFNSKLAPKNSSNKLKLSVSAGVALYRKGETMDDLINRADKALYLAKNNGRNRVQTEYDV